MLVSPGLKVSVPLRRLVVGAGRGAGEARPPLSGGELDRHLATADCIQGHDEEEVASGPSRLRSATTSVIAKTGSGSSLTIVPVAWLSTRIARRFAAEEQREGLVGLVQQVAEDGTEIVRELSPGKNVSVLNVPGSRRHRWRCRNRGPCCRSTVILPGPAALVSVTGKSMNVVPELPSTREASTTAIRGSSSTIVPTPWLSGNVAFTGVNRSTKNVSSCSSIRSPKTATWIGLFTSPGRKVSVPLVGW